jgi:mRNA interferase MazF
VRRGEIWTAAGGGSFAGKPRPIVILQSDLYSETASVTVCGLTTDPTDAPDFRIIITPGVRNGLLQESRIMVDKIVTLRRSELGRRIGTLDHADIIRLDRAVVVFLGLGGRPARAE